MKLRSIVLGAGVVVVIAFGAAVYFLLTSLDGIVERAIERYGSEITGTAVRVASVDISLSSGRGTVRGLTVANPEGFSSGSAFRLEEITLQLDVGTVTSSPIVLDEIAIRAPAALFEVNKAGAANVDEIRKNAERYQPAEDHIVFLIKFFAHAHTLGALTGKKSCCFAQSFLSLFIQLKQFSDRINIKRFVFAHAVLFQKQGRIMQDLVDE